MWRNMKFVVESVSQEGVRSGRLSWGTSGQNLATPALMLYTRSGAEPHLTPDLLEAVFSSSAEGKLAQLTLPSIYDSLGVSVSSRRGIHGLCNRKEDFLYLCVQDPCQPPRDGYNEERSVSVWCRGGRSKVTVEKYLGFVEAARPNAFEALFDSVAASQHKVKRIKKSVNRSLAFLDQTLEIYRGNEVLRESSILGAVVGSDVIEERKRSAIETAKRPVDGFVLEGFDISYDEDKLRTILHSGTQPLAVSKPRFIHGLHAPDKVFAGLECGVDVFDGGYPYAATKAGCALVFNNSLTADCQPKDSPQELKLHDSRFSMDLQPIFKGCSCYTCAHHSRAYIHHLLNTNEILASVLLMLHNLTHNNNFFTNLREAIHHQSYPMFKQSCSLTNT